MNHIENLAKHEEVSIEPCGAHAASGVPIWLNVSPEAATTDTYENLTWEKELAGEYLYYLAGDFPKNEKGLLRYASAKTSAEVFVCYEDDVIEVAEHDSKRFAACSSEASQGHTEFSDMTIGDGFASDGKLTRPTGVGNSFIRLEDRRAELGCSSMRVSETFNGDILLTISCDIVDNSGPMPRLTSIAVRSIDPQQKIGPLCEYAFQLMERYCAIQHHELTGAIRD